MKKILITGATGNVGVEVLRGLRDIGTGHELVVAHHDTERAQEILHEFGPLEYRRMDFTDPEGCKAALEGIDRVFLLRPPGLADVPKYFEPFLDAMISKGIREIVFLSVQGVEHQKSIPHHKLEKLILEKGLDHAFLRPSYFMQNLSTTLVHEIRTRATIFIPAGKLKFTWVDVRDIGLVAAHVLNDFERHKNRNYVITGSEQMDFHSVAALLSDVLERKITYESPGLIKFFRQKRRLGMDRMMIFVMIMLHYLPRFSRTKNEITDTVEQITGRAPGTLRAWLDRNKNSFS